MYRLPAEPESDAPREGAEFVYVGKSQEHLRRPGMILVEVLLLPLLLTTALAWVSRPLGIVGFVASAVFVAFWWKGKTETTVVRIERGVLAVSSSRSKTTRFSVELAQLDNVLLDSRTIQRVTEGDSAIPAMRLLDSKVGPDVDVTRIALIAADGRRCLLTDEHMPYTETSEAFGKLRVFLRKHGWVPADEREDDDEHDGDAGNDDAAVSSE